MPKPTNASAPIIIIAMKQPLIDKQVMIAKQLPLTTLPIRDWQQAASEPAATPTGWKPMMQHDKPMNNIIAAITIPTINITSYLQFIIIKFIFDCLFTQSGKIISNKFNFMPKGFDSICV